MTTNGAERIKLFFILMDYVVIFSIASIPLLYLSYESITSYNDVYFLIGYFAYGGLLEYPIHKYIYHAKNDSISRLHLLHHFSPKLLLPTLHFFAVYLLAGAIFMVGDYLFGMTIGTLIGAGITFGYFLYMLLHDMIHHFPRVLKKLKLGYIVQKHGEHHKHKTYNFCVSQPFWDVIYKTNYKKSHLDGQKINELDGGVY